jgi:hypothetical protein
MQAHGTTQPGDAHGSPGQPAFKCGCPVTQRAGRYAAWLMRTSRTSCDFIVLAATALVTQFLESFKEFPPRQKAASFTIDQVVEKLEAAITSHR